MKRPVFFAVIAAVIAATMFTAACRRGLDTSIWAARPGERIASGFIALPDGVYSGVGSGGFGGNVYVDVTVAGNAITSIAVTGHGETQAFANSVFAEIGPSIMARQATGVDAVAGATLTSSAFIAAVEDALVTGGADLASVRLGRPALLFTPGIFAGVGTGGFGGDIHVDVEFGEAAILGITVTAHSEPPALAGSVFDRLTQQILARQSTEVDAIAGATGTVNAFLAAVSAAVESSVYGASAPVLLLELPASTIGQPVRFFTPGIFGGVGTGGVGGDISVDVEFDGAAIVGITVTAHSEPQTLADFVFAPLIQEILARQSTDVDAVAGATPTVNAFLAAVAEAVEQAEQ